MKHFDGKIKFIIFLGVLALNLAFLKYFTSIENSIASSFLQRAPGSIGDSGKIKKSVSSCISSIKSFIGRDTFSQDLYESYLVSYRGNKDNFHAKKKFDSVEDYVAWIDSRFIHEDFSVAKNFIKASQIPEFSKLKTDLTRPEYLFSFFTKNLLEGIIKKSVKIEGMSEIKLIFLKKELTQKLADEAMASLSRPNSKFSSFMKKAFNNKFVNLLSYVPLFYGMPPLKLPDFLIKNEKLLLNFKTSSEAKEFFFNASRVDKSLVNAKFIYNILNDHYTKLIAIYYFYFVYLDFEKIEQNEELLTTLNEEVDQSIKDLIELNAPSCDSIQKCLEEYRLEWDIPGSGRYEEYKKTCQEIYDVSDC